MISNNGGIRAGLLAGKYEGLIGHLYGPGGERGPYDPMPWAMDNAAFASAKAGAPPWSRLAWIRALDWAARAARTDYPPLFALVRDIPFDREGTLAAWKEYVREVRDRKLRPAFAVQDGMTFADVPDSECILFLGGGSEWKDASIGPWCAKFPGRVHVGRVTEQKRLMACYRAGAVSVDGNNWFMDTNKPGARAQREVLKEFMALQKRELDRRAA